MLEIEITSIELIEKGGIEVLARAWLDGLQIGFDKDGSVDIERFRFYNPPVFVADVNGAIMRTRVLDDGEVIVQRYTENPEEALLSMLETAILNKKYKIVGSTNIVSGKVGSTTITIYSEADTDGYMGDTDTSWSTLRDQTETDPAKTLSTTSIQASASKVSTTYYLNRGFTEFDTSVLGAGASISSATFNLRQYTRASAGTHTLNFCEGTWTGEPDGTNWGSFVADKCSDTDVSCPNGDDWRNWTMNATGIAAINDTASTYFMVRCACHDFANTGGTTTANNVFYTAEDATYDPYIYIEYTAGAPAATANALFMSNF